MKNKILSLCLSLIIVLGSFSFAFAAPTTADQYAQYSGTGWSYNSSSHNFIANNQLSNSVPYVILSYLRDMYSQLSFDNSGYGYSYSNNTMRGIDISGNGKTSGGLYNIGKLIGLLNTNLMSQFVFTTNANEVPLYSWKQFTDTNLYHWDFSNGDFIDNFVNGIASVNNNVAYIANQLYSDSSNNRSLINQAFHSIVNNLDFLSDIDNNTDGLESINNDIKNNTGYIYSESQGIHSDTSDIKSINNNIYSESQGIHSDTTDLNTKIQILTDNFNDISWENSNLSVEGFYRSADGDKIESQINSSNWFIKLNWVNLSNGYYKLNIPMFIGGNSNVDIKVEFGFLTDSGFSKINDAILTYDQQAERTNIYFFSPIKFFSSSNRYAIHVIASNNNLFVNPLNSSSSQFISYDKLDYYTVFNSNVLRNILGLFNQAKVMFFDDDSIQAKKNNAGQTSAVIDGFTADGDASASASDFGAVKDGVSNVKSGVDTNVSASSAFGGFNSEEGYSFFSQTTLNNLDTTNSNRRLLRSNNDNNSAYDDRLNAIYDLMGVNHD